MRQEESTNEAYLKYLTFFKQQLVLTIGQVNS